MFHKKEEDSKIPMIVFGIIVVILIIVILGIVLACKFLLDRPIKNIIVKNTTYIKDDYILEKFSFYTKNTNKLIKVNRQNKGKFTAFSVKREKWVNDLSKFGVIPNKTFNVELPILSEDVMPHLIRGLIDGDGWISEKGKQIGFCGNEKCVTQLRDYLCSKLNISIPKIIHPDTNLWQITWHKKNDIRTICEFMYKDGQAIWPKLAVNYTNKTQFIFKINKGVESVFDTKDVNRFMEESKRPVPFSRMIYFGDGTTDIPCMKLVKNFGGHSIAVYNPEEEGQRTILNELIRDNRVNHVCPADYSADSEIDTVVKTIIDKVVMDQRLADLEIARN